MRYIIAFALLMALLTVHARAAESTKYTVENKVATKYTVENKAAPAVKVKTLCACAETLTCTCWESQCSCVRCGRGGAATQSGKPRSSTDRIIHPTDARHVDTSRQPEPGRGFQQGSVGTAPTRIPARSAQSVVIQLGGGTNCPTGTT